VYLARQRSLDRLVALKILAPAVPEQGSLSDRFKNEGWVMARFRHRNIVDVYGLGATPEGGAYLAMSYVRGVPLSAVIDFLKARPGPAARAQGVLDFVAAQVGKREAALPPDAAPGPLPRAKDDRPFVVFAAEMMGRLAEALHAAHARGLIHRDVKPSNILLTSEGTPVLADFGMALAKDRPRMTAAGELLGTPLYAAPECLRFDSRQADERSDVYSLGVVFYELLTGRPPFDGRDLLQLLGLIQKGGFPAPRALNKAVPRAMESILLRCLRKNPGRRTPTAAHLARDLRRFLNGKPVRGPGVLGRLGLEGNAGRLLRAFGTCAVAALVLAGTETLLRRIADKSAPAFLPRPERERA
jgi:serine/threonine protein kinase